MYGELERIYSLRERERARARARAREIRVVVRE